jgi:GNAT superfamily N-acetyltransferase
MADNLQRMIELITSFFDTRNDPDQVSVTKEEREKLEQIHPDTLSEMANEDGPMVWILLIPTTEDIMNRFLAGTISEKQLLQETKPGDKYDTIYLCSAYVLPEFRHKGLARKVTLEAISRIRKDHNIKSLFYWPFSTEGKASAEALAKNLALPLYEKK